MFHLVTQSPGHLVSFQETILKANIALLPGDGIGPEVVAEAVRVLRTVAENYGHASE